MKRLAFLVVTLALLFAGQPSLSPARVHPGFSVRASYVSAAGELKLVGPVAICPWGR